MLALAAEFVELAFEDKVAFLVAELLDDVLEEEEGLELEEVMPSLVLVLKVVAEELGFGVLETPVEDEEAMLEATFEAELA